MQRVATWVRGLRAGDVLVGVVIGLMLGTAGPIDAGSTAAPAEVHTERVTVTETVTEPADRDEIDELAVAIDVEHDRLATLTRKIATRANKLDKRKRRLDRRAERLDAREAALDGRSGDVAPPPEPDRAPAGAPPEPDVAPAVSYANCDAVRAAGAASIRRGEPGYGPHLDRDGDGVACE